MWKGFSRQIGHGGLFSSRVCRDGPLVRTMWSSLRSVGTVGISLAGAPDTVVDSTGNALEDAEDFLVSFFTDFRFAGGSGGTVSLALDR